MNNGEQKKNGLILYLLAASVVLSVILNAAAFGVQKYVLGENILLFTPEKYTAEALSYDISPDGSFTVTGDDPQLIFRNVNTAVSSAEIKLYEPAVQDIRVQLYYSDGAGFSEEKSVIGFIGTGDSFLKFELSGLKCRDIRFDMDGNFRLESISLDKNITFSINRVLITELIFLVIITAYAVWRSLPKRADRLSIYELLYWLACFGYYFIWSCTKPYNYAPDEYMRYPVSEFIFRNDRLPVGAETGDNPWGFSYAQMPTMLCNYLGYIPMKLTSLFTSDEYALVVAARFGSVLCGGIFLLYIIKTAKLLFPRPINWIVTVFVSMMPQLCFLCSYINNDICALCGAAMILYSWVRIVKEGWHSSLSAVMAVGIGICGISYYNSYGWVLMCVIMLLSYIIINKDDRKRLLRQGLLIAGITVAIMAFPFIRQYVVFGDLLGFKTTSYYGELYAMDSLKPSVRRALTIRAQGIPLWDMLFGMGWLRTVYKSFIGVFGYMAYPVSSVITKGYFILFCIMGVTLIVIAVKGITNISRENIKKEYRNIIFYVCLIGSMIIPVLLSVMYSYGNDYQAQGRYIYSAFPGLAVFFGTAYSALLGRIKDQKLSSAVTAALCFVFIAFNLQSFFGTYLPT